MKMKFLSLSLILAGACVVANAQEAKDNYYTEKPGNNIFLGIGAGIQSVNNSGFKAVSPHLYLELGKYITPTWAVRGVINGWEQHLNYPVQGTDHKKNYIGLNIDGMVNLSNLLCGTNVDRTFEVYGFLGPQMNVAKAPTSLVVEVDPNNGTSTEAMGEEKTRVRIGASAGLGARVNFNNAWALNLEARGSIAPSNFGWNSAHHRAEGVGTLTLGLTHTFGGKKFAKVSDRVVEKEVIKEVVREVPKEVIKEVVKEVPGAGEVAIFFKINRAKISEEGMVNIKLMAKAMKANPNAKYKVAGFADKATGTPAINQSLSERRAQAVYDALVAEGVNPNQLEKVAMGGTDNMFGKNYLNRVVILEVK